MQPPIRWDFSTSGLWFGAVKDGCQKVCCILCTPTSKISDLSLLNYKMHTHSRIAVLLSDVSFHSQTIFGWIQTPAHQPENKLFNPTLLKLMLISDLICWRRCHFNQRQQQSKKLDMFSNSLCKKRRVRRMIKDLRSVSTSAQQSQVPFNLRNESPM